MIRPENLRLIILDPTTAVALCERIEIARDVYVAAGEFWRRDGRVVNDNGRAWGQRDPRKPRGGRHRHPERVNDPLRTE